MDGKGIHKWPDGRMYEGEYLNDKKHVKYLNESGPREIQLV
jgi:MORN repeat